MTPTPLDLYNRKVEQGSLQADPHQKEALATLDTLFQRLFSGQPRDGFLKKLISRISGEDIRGIYLYGDVGRGKTMVMDLFVEAIPADTALRRVHFHAFMRDVHDYLHAHPKKGIIGLVKTISKQTDILAFDEFHVGDVADAMILQRLFSALIDKGLIVITTSNYPPQRLYEGGLQRQRFLPFIDLIEQTMEVIELSGPVDYRARELGCKNTYFSPLNGENKERAARLYKQWSCGIDTAQQHLQLKGRKMTVTAAGNVALCPFSELCERPTGAEDYQALADTFPTIFITDIPRLGYDRRNEAKRFMTLIDVLYEARSRIVITAAEQPEDLYQGHDHEFEFQRTVSRIHEMTSENYLTAFQDDKKV